jgi:LysR family transcriptional activator of dmlA
MSYLLLYGLHNVDHMLPKDLTVFLAVARRMSFAAAAEDIGMSAAFVSKRIDILERTLGCRLMIRSSRGVHLTEQGRVTALRASEILSAYQDLKGDLEGPQSEPQGDLRVTASAGMGRGYIAPVLAMLSRAHPRLNIRLEITDQRVNLSADKVDIDIRVGGTHGDAEIVHPLARGRRILCAAPAYLDRFGSPDTLDALAKHQCLLIRERSDPIGRWSLVEQDRQHSVQITSALSSNDGEVVRRWSLTGYGIMLRSYWDVAEALKDGELQHILPRFHQPADISAVTMLRSAHSPRVRRAIEFLRDALTNGRLALAVPPLADS